jgi:hypothetical protein
VWCQFAQTIFYYPALLAYVASTLAYIVDPSLANNGIYTAAIIIVLFWGGVLVSTRGVGIVAKLSSSGTVIGTLIPGAILVVLAVVYLLQGNHSAAPMNVHHVLPAWSGLASIVLVVNSFFTYAGIEVTAVHVDELRDPGRQYPRAMFLATAVVLAVFILPTLAISWVIPSHHISLTAGVMQAFNRPVPALPSWIRRAADGGRAGRRRAGRDDRLARRSRRGSARNRTRAGVPPAVLSEDQTGGSRDPDPGRPGSRDHGDRPALRARADRVQRVLDLRGDGHAGVPDHVRADVHRRAAAAASNRITRAATAPRRLDCCARLAAPRAIVAFLIGFVAPSQLAHTSPFVYGLLILTGIFTIGILPPLLLLRFRKPSWKAPLATPATT